MRTTAITIDIARHTKAGVGGWAWVDDQGHRKARWMNTDNARALYRAAVASARHDLGLRGQITVSVRADADLAELCRRAPRRVNFKAGTDEATLEQARRLAQRALTTGSGRRYTGAALTTPGLRISCDGSYDDNTRTGGWAWYLDEQVHACDAVVGAESSTEMEYRAALEALSEVADGIGVTVLTDCKILVDSVHGRRDGKSPKMRGHLRDLTEELRAELERTGGQLTWVPSHSGIDGNTQADRAARGAVRTTVL